MKEATAGVLGIVVPVPLAEVASFEPDLARRTAEAAAFEAAGSGIDWTFSPMVDVARDQRWGRGVEGGGNFVEHERLYGDTSALNLPTRSYAFDTILHDPVVRQKLVHGSDWPIISVPTRRIGWGKALRPGACCSRRRVLRASAAWR